jgi:hypothetical protein
MALSGPRYDDAMKRLCVHVPGALCQWLGVDTDHEVTPIRLSEMAPRLATRQVDALLAVGDDLVVHVEFQAGFDSFFAWRMLDYRSLLARRPELAGRTLVQHAVALGAGRLEDTIHDDQLHYRFTVHYLRQQPVDQFMVRPDLAPFAVLARVPGDEWVGALRQALDLVATEPDPHRRDVLAQATVDLAAIRLEPDIIQKTWEESTMPIPSLLNKLFEEGRTEGREEMVAEFVRHRFGDDGRIPAIARQLVHLSSTDLMTVLDRADGLDDLA